MLHGSGASSQSKAAGQVMITRLAGGKRDGVYVTFWGTAWAEGQRSPARGPNIGLNFHNTGNEKERERDRGSDGGDKRTEVKGRGRM